MADLKDKIQTQIEFYFSDSNFPKDKFLRAQSALNEEGYIPISVFLTFNRVKSISSDVEVIKEALKQSPKLKVSDDGLMVKRVDPLPSQDDSNERSIYVKGTPVDTTIEELTKVFSAYGKVLSVRIRKTLEKTNKDSTFIEFEKKEEADKAAAASPLPKVRDTEVTKIETKTQYFERKKEERKTKKGGNDNNNKRKSDNNNGEKAESGEKEVRKFEWTKGLIVGFKNVGDDVSRETVKETFSKYGNVAFVDFKKGDTEGQLRFSTPAEATAAATTTDTIEIGGKTVEKYLLEGEEENKYWEKVQTFVERNKMKNKKGDKRGGKKQRKRF